MTFLLSSLVYGEVFKWVDENGRVHYGDKPTQETAAEEIKVQSGASTPSMNDEERREYQKRLLEAMSIERDRKQQQAQQAKEYDAKVKKNCETARKKLKEYNESGYLYRENEAGQREILSDKERADATDKAKAAVDKWCK